MSAVREGQASRHRRRARGMLALRRRGVFHGRFPAPERGPEDLWTRRGFLAACEDRWALDRPVILPGALARGLRRFRGEVRASRAMFERLRGGASFGAEVRRRLGGSAGFALLGSTTDVGDEPEIEKFYVDAVARGRTVARGLYAKLSWIARDERDPSLRVRFSFGSERLMDWRRETRRAPWSDRYAEALFPECAAIARDRRLLALVERLIGRRARFSERIAYSNAPGGGAVFHHDDEPRQLGVVFGQLAGETAWLALPKRELAAHVVSFLAGERPRGSPRSSRSLLRRRAGTPARALRALDREHEHELAELLNSTPAFTRRLVEHGVLFHLRPGDALLLPNHGPDDTCWHSVFALGKEPSLAHSYGIFRRRARAFPLDRLRATR